jgi:hypothetical protein
MTVLDNLALGSFVTAARRQRAKSLEQVLTLFPALKAKLRDQAGSLSGGQQQMVAIGRAMMARPLLLLLDEPSLGLAPAIVHDMFRAIRAINAEGTSVLLVEQNVAMAMELAVRAYVMEEGRIVAEGPASDLLSRPEIRRAYLGIEAAPGLNREWPTARPGCRAVAWSIRLLGPAVTIISHACGRLPKGRWRRDAGFEVDMKTLLLIRHAKAEPPAAGIVDHDRTLADRGRRDAPEMGRRLERLNLKPNLMISSTAARAAATAD